MQTIPNLNGSTVLIGGFAGMLTQSLLDTIGPARIHDIYGHAGFTRERNGTLLVIGKLVMEFAQLCNFTPVLLRLGSPSPTKLESNHSSLPRQNLIIPFVVPSVVSPHFTPMNQSKASFSLAMFQFFNFVYCDYSKKILGIDLKVIGRPFDQFVWLCLILSGAVIAGVCSSIKNARKDVGKVALVTFAAVFSQSTIHGNSKSLLILLWFAGCLILNNMYSSVVTSLLVAPVEGNVIKTVDELAARNYRIVYTAKFDYLHKMVRKLAFRQNHDSSIQTLVNNMIIMPSGDIKAYFQVIAFQKNRALLAPYMAALSFWQLLTDMNYERWRKTKSLQFRNRFCYIGRELTSKYSIPEVWIFNMNKPKLSKDLAHAFHRFDSAGFHDFWMKVFFRIQVAKSRAQNIYKFKSKTEVKQEVPVEPLDLLTGSTLVIFVLYALCVLICLGIFFLELFASHCLHNNIRSTTPVFTFLE